ncbi:MAG: 1,4-dihydroxy-2-naphthoate polyprenyltransferase [Bacteroidales bacterium]|nr:1,4-dihydroxy-2-naphthoate polyprenyltransferase [Bacteroidales bacterium]
MKQTILIWIHAFRLRTLPLALSSTFLGSFLAYSKSHFRISVFIFASVTTLFLQILSNLANDYGDGLKGTDKKGRLGPERLTQSGKVSPNAMRNMIIVFVLLSLTVGSTLIFIGLKHFPVVTILVFFILGSSAILAAIKYTVGKNPYGYVGLGDMFVFIFFGIVGVCGTFYLHTGYFDPWILFPASTIGLFSSCVLNINNLRDIKSDSECGKKTLVVRLGVKAAKIYHGILVLSAVLMSMVYTVMFFKSPVQLLFMITLPFLLLDVKNVMMNTVPIELNRELLKMALTTFAFSLTFGLGLVL